MYVVGTIYIHCVREKDQNVYRNIFYETLAIPIKFSTFFLNKFAAKLCKRFPLHLNIVSYTTYCET